MSSSNTNSILQLLQSPNDYPDFYLIQDDDFADAIRHIIQQFRLNIESIIANEEEPDFFNTIEALEIAEIPLEKITGVFFNLHSAETNDKREEIAEEITPILSEINSWVSLNPQLYEKVKQASKNTSKEKLLPEQNLLLTETLKGFSRSGADLGNEDKKTLEKINEELSLAQLKFGQNVLHATNAYHKKIYNISLLKGVPESTLELFRNAAKAYYENNPEEDLANQAPYIISLQQPSYIAALTYLENRELRKELYIAQQSKNATDNEWNNNEIILTIIKLRNAKAKLLGYPSYAEFVLEERMAKSSQKVIQFLEDLAREARPYAEKDMERLQNFALEYDPSYTQLMPWDHMFFEEKLRQKEYALDEERIRAYFPIEAVQKAAFDLAEKLFGLHFQSANIPVYHPDVKVFYVLKNKECMGIFYVDYFPREGKRPGAWMTHFYPQYNLKFQEILPEGLSSKQIPVVSIVCNFNPPQESKGIPALLSFNDVTTLFHEFGHALHGLLANTVYPSFSGTSVKWDFVELPSQFFENYCLEEDFLSQFAKHYATNEALPTEDIEAISKLKSFMQGYQTMRQISFGVLDMAYHGDHPEAIHNVKEFETHIIYKYSMYPTVKESSLSTSFSHIFQGGYAAGYYSYKWAEVLDADAFYYFKTSGIYNPNIAKKFEKLLSSGGTIPPMDLYKEFRGEEPKAEYLLKRAFGN